MFHFSWYLKKILHFKAVQKRLCGVKGYGIQTEYESLFTTLEKILALQNDNNSKMCKIFMAFKGLWEIGILLINIHSSSFENSIAGSKHTGLKSSFLHFSQKCVFPFNVFVYR